MAGVTTEQVEQLVFDHNHLLELVALKEQMSANLDQLVFDIHLQQHKTMGYLGSPMLRISFLAWADRNVTSENPHIRSLAQRMRAVIERVNKSPLFEDGTTPTLTPPPTGTDAP